MRNKILIAVLAALAAFPVLAQGPPVSKQVAQQYDTPPFVQAPTIQNFSAAPAALGSATCYYWLIVNTSTATSAPLSLPLFICPTTAGGTAQNPVSLSWQAVPDPTAKYDVLETTTSAIPTGTNTVAVAIGLNVANLTDSGQARSAYTLLPAGLAWNEFNNLVGGIPTLQWCYNGNCILNVTPSGVNVTPTTGAPNSSPTATAFFSPPVPPNTAFMGPCVNCLGGTYDGQTTNATGSTTVSSVSQTFQPTLSNNELLFFFAEGDPSIGPVFSTPSGWTQDSGTSVNMVAHLLLTNKNSTTALSTVGPSSTVAYGIFGVNTNGSPTRVTNVSISSGNMGNGPQLFTRTPTAGNAVFIYITAQTSGFTTFTGRVEDSAGDVFTPVIYQQNPISRLLIVGWMSLFVKGGSTNFTVTYSGNGQPTGLNGNLQYQEWSGIGSGGSSQSGFNPTFRYIEVADLPPGGVGTALPPTFYSFASNVAVAATTATNLFGTTGNAAAPTIVMPASGCPCRVFVSYSLYITTATSGVGYSAWINDGTNNYGGSNEGQSNGSSGGLTELHWAGYSNVTYNNNQSVTFNLVTEGDHTYTMNAASLLAGSAPNSNAQFRTIFSQ